MTSALISCAELAAARGRENLHVLDASYYLPNEGKNPHSIFLEGHISGAQFFDIDLICERTSHLPHMLPNASDFAKAASQLGLKDADEIIVYDQRGIFSAARVWWMFRTFGHTKISVLNGGLPAWRDSGLPVVAGAAQLPKAGSFTAKFDASKVRSLAEMQRNLVTHKEAVLDARAAGRFDGSVPEPRPGMRSGHIPGAKSMPFQTLQENGHMLPPDALRKIFTGAGITPETAVVTSCGSGVTAAVITLGLAIAGLPEGTIYDGSWSEWGSLSDTPIEV